MSLLSSDAGKIRPLILPQDTQLPSILYQRNYDITNTKDRYSGGEATVSITILTAEYLEGVTLAELVRSSLESYADPSINRIYLTAGTEAFVADAFMQSMTFILKARVIIP